MQIKKERTNKNTTEKIFTRTNILDGINLKIRSIIWTILSIAFLIVGLYFLFFEKGFWWIGVMFIILSILVIYVIKTLWKIGGERIKGRYY